MSACYISLGLTITKERPLTSEGEIRAAVEPFRDQIIAHLAEIDTADYIEATESDPVDEIVTGVLWLADPNEYNSWTVPHTDFAFITSGGMTFGDSPFDEYDAVVFASNAAAALPLLGRAVGILGGGIRTSHTNEGAS